jgi:hypothetical protein
MVICRPVRQAGNGAGGYGPDKSKKSNAMILGLISSFIGDPILALLRAHIMLWSGDATLGSTRSSTSFFDGHFCRAQLSPGRLLGLTKLFAFNTGCRLVGLILGGRLLAV